ncbi:DUF7144 family membrane protein [Kitasatospora camelliae]|uniref:DUF7144 domain-containing protein n=1 Tax=Kitasatospora camelliae TaxID=3156397 RepID=A0AAU8JU49_9ACTN
MSSASTPPPAPPAPGRGYERSNSAWVTGMVLFAGVVMMVNGILEMFQGIMAISEDEVFVTTPKYIFQFDLTSWGWIHLFLGLLVAVTGFFVITGQTWARVVGIFLVSLSLLGSFLAIPYHALWSLVVLALDVFVIWALCVYREE